MDYKISDLPAISSVSLQDLIEIVDVSDITDSVQGTSKSSTIEKVLDAYLSTVDKGYIVITSPVALANSVSAQAIFNKTFKALPNKRYRYELIIYCTGLSGSQNILIGFNNSQFIANNSNGIISAQQQGNATRASVSTGFSSFSIIPTEIVVTGTSTAAEFNGGFTGTLRTGNAPSGTSFVDIIPVIKTPIGQAAAYISRAFFMIEEVGNNTDLYKGNFQ